MDYISAFAFVHLDCIYDITNWSIAELKKYDSDAIYYL